MKCLINELLQKSPFEIYCERKTNKLVHDGKGLPTDIETLSTTVPTDNDYRNQAKQINNWQKSAKAADDQWQK